MNLWMLFLTVMVLFLILSLVYLVSRFHRFRLIQRLAGKHRVLSWLVSLLPLGLLACFALINVFTMIIVSLHLMLCWLLSDLLFRILRKNQKGRPYYAGILAILLCIVYLGIGWYNAHHVRETHYELTTEKDLQGEPLRIALIADAHLGITLDGADFGRELARIEEADPDILCIAGDFVDDDTSREDMLSACAALGRWQPRYGTYWVYGNHDKGYYRYRNFTSAELRGALETNGVTILEDENRCIDDRFYIIGRQDRTTPGRASAESLTAGLDPDLYQIMLDHQPNDYAGEAASGADLVLSGHTHGGHIFPAGLIGLWTGANDRTYGTETRGETTFVVTSGISGWAIPFKTGTFSEYVILDVAGSNR